MTFCGMSTLIIGAGTMISKERLKDFNQEFLCSLINSRSQLSATIVLFDMNLDCFKDEYIKSNYNQFSPQKLSYATVFQKLRNPRNFALKFLSV